jgi:hypothetical protein
MKTFIKNKEDLMQFVINSRLVYGMLLFEECIRNSNNPDPLVLSLRDLLIPDGVTGLIEEKTESLISHRMKETKNNNNSLYPFLIEEISIHDEYAFYITEIIGRNAEVAIVGSS